MSLNQRQIESWALSILDRLARGQTVEDQAVELKSEWPDSTKCARRIAGHANAARGQPILWLVGVDEVKGVIGAKNIELADWWNQVVSEFDSVAPSLISVNLVWEQLPVIALQFDTTRSPFVVRNPEYGKSGGGPVEREVPWREGTGTRSANHNDLILLMTPLSSVPFLKPVGAALILQISRPEKDQYLWNLFMRVFISMELGQRVVILDSDCEAVCTLNTEIQCLTLMQLTTDSCSGGVVGLTYGVACESPGLFRIKGSFRTRACSFAVPDQIEVSLRIAPVGAERPITVPIVLDRIRESDPNCLNRWAQLGYDTP